MPGTLDAMLADESPPPQRPRWRRPVAIGGVVLMLAGLGVLAWVAWQYFGTNIIAKQRQDQMTAELQQQWDDGTDPVAIGKDLLADGEAMALLRVPRFAPDFEVPVIKGIDDQSLASGVGWFSDTQRPGRVGNFALAGHRVTHGEPFRDFMELRDGDKLYVETRSHVYTYVLDDNGTDHAVPFTETWILDPVPGEPENTKPTEPLITLMTCSELFHTDNRSYVVGHLIKRERKNVS